MLDEEEQQQLVVETRNGKVRGVLQRSKVEGFEYCAFKGIPYAKPPVGDLRFQEPQPAENWTGIRDASKYGNNCAQYEATLRAYGGSEDCLFVNVFVKSMKNVDVKKPVMVWFHGGGFLFGSGDDLHFGPDYLMRKDIVLVTFNYRLGVFGFLNLENEIAPGNYGVKDQILALKWVQANIEKFGGDRNNVTLFGESAGAVFIHCVALTPLAKGLFHKIISQSGTGFCPWSLLDEPKKYASQLCSILGRNIYEPKEMFEFLKSIDSKRLILAQEKLRSSFKPFYVAPFMVSVDDKSPNPIVQIPIIERNPLEAVEVPSLIGCNNKDGAAYLIGLNKKDYDTIDKNFSKIIKPRQMKLMNNFNLTAKNLRKFYFDNEKITESNTQKLSDMLHEWKFLYGVQKMIQVQVEQSSAPVYAFKFSYDEKNTLTKSMMKQTINGAIHFDDVEFLFYNRLRREIGFDALKKGTKSYRIMEQMTEMWTNFATYGNPTPEKTDLLPVEWLPANDSMNISYLNIDTELEMKVEENIEKKFIEMKSLLK